MKRNYYYTVCSLPAVNFEADRPPVSWTDYLRICAIEVPPAKVELLGRLGLLPREDMLGKHPVLDQWILFEGGLRNALSRLRSQRLELSEETYERAAYPGNFPLEEARKLLGDGTPMETELRIDRMRWNRLEELDHPFEFDLGRLVVYGLKLRVLERRTRFEVKAGESTLGEAVGVPGTKDHGFAGRAS